MMERCPLCPGINNVVPGDGPPCSDYMFIGEAPGADENKKLKCFIGKTGDEFNQQYLPLAGLYRPQVYVTNVIKCLPPGEGKITVSDKGHLEMARSCAEFHLHKEIQRVNPKVIIPMGAFANSLIPDIDLELHHSMPFDWLIGDDIGSYPVFPMWHPAQGLYDHKRIGMLRQDFIRLRKYLAGKLVLPFDDFSETMYMEVKTAKRLRMELEAYMDLAIAIDTETTRKRRAFCTTFSVHPGTGFLIRADNEEVLREFAKFMRAWQAEILIHNSLFDIPILGQMGVTIPRKRLVDTMMRIYHLQNFPQGLKTAAYRLLGMEMQDFDDLVSPYSTSRVLNFLHEVNTHKWERGDEYLERDKHGKWIYHKPQSVNTKIKRLFTDLGKNEKLNIFDRYENWTAEHEMIEAKCGEYPGKCITHVPFEKVLHYACRDADATVRLWPVIKRALSRQRRQPDYEWWEAA